MTDHKYIARLSWHGTTAGGYGHYTRDHRVAVPPATTTLSLSAEQGFLGDPSLANPEQLLVAATSSCQLLSFLAVAAHSGVDVLSYEDAAEAVMPENEKPMRITRIVLRPRVVVAPGTDLDRVRRLIGKAHDRCFIANTLNAEVWVDADVEHVGTRADHP